jgi:hypothetical protein
MPSPLRRLLNAAFFRPDINDFLDRCVDHAFLVRQFHLVRPVHRMAVRQGAPDGIEFSFLQHETREKRRPARFFELNAGRLVPDHVLGSQVHDQHEHVHRVDGRAHAPAEDGAHVVPRLPGKRKFDADLAEVMRDEGDARACRAIGREKIEAPPVEP